MAWLIGHRHHNRTRLTNNKDCLILMANITDPTSIPTALRPDLKALLVTVGPQVLGDNYPATADPENLTNAELATVFELVTREFWRQQIQAHKANEAAEAARLAAVESSAADPFA